jgi:hypothetical protein
MFMSQGRGTTTDRLANVIQVIQLGRKTGQLAVERGEGTLLEQGEIIFVRGQIVQARSRHLTGQKALDWLSTWETCRFAFIPPATERVTRPLLALPAPQRTSTQPLKEILPPTPTNGGQETAPRGTTGPLYGDLPAPQRISQVDDALWQIDQAGLSRLHRRLFLLLDGQRTIAALARLTGRSYEEVQRLLRDLERLGVIQQ